MTKMVENRRLRRESERVNPDTNHAVFITASLLDQFSADREERWLAEHEHDQSAILTRYQTADDRLDGAFVRLVEQRYGLKDDDAHIEDPARLVVASPLTKAVRARQDSRVPKAITEALAKLTEAENRYTFVRGLTFGNMNQAVGAMLRRAK
jgi:hypothetical protein